MSWRSSTRFSAAPPQAPACGPSPGYPPLSSCSSACKPSTQSSRSSQHHPLPLPRPARGSTPKRRSQETPPECQVVVVPLVPLTLACLTQERLLQDQLCTECVQVLHQCSCSISPSAPVPPTASLSLRLSFLSAHMVKCWCCGRPEWQLC